MKVGVGIVTYRGYTRVEYLLESICRRDPGLSRADISIHLHDDGSPGGVPGTLAQDIEAQVGTAWGGAMVSASATNRGIAHAWNRATEALIVSGCDIVALLNDDIVVTDQWLAPMVYFLDQNPGVGSASWPQFFFDTEDYPALLDAPESAPCRHPIERGSDGRRRTVERPNVGDGRPGRIMCPAGSAFAFTPSKFAAAGGFPERYISFHEESAYGATLASKGFPSFGLGWPFVHHKWSATFHESPELRAGETMRHSRACFCQDFGVPVEYAAHPFDHTHPRLMAHLPAMTVRWTGPNGPREVLDPPCTCPQCSAYRAASHV